MIAMIAIIEQTVEQKIFHAEIVVDTEKVNRETAKYKKIPEIVDFRDIDGNDTMKEQVQFNYERIKKEVLQIVEDEKERTKSDPNLRHLIKEEQK